MSRTSLRSVIIGNYTKPRHERQVIAHGVKECLVVTRDEGCAGAG
jgi:hypothetical protein